MKKEFLMLFALCLFSMKTMAAEKNDSIDQCQFVVVYDFVTNTHNKNGDATKDSVQLGTVVGTHVAKCMEYNRVMMEDFKEFRNKDYQMGEWNARPYNLPILFIGEPEGEISSFDKIVPNRYFYTEPTPNFGWELTDDTLTVGGYLCKKAVGKYAGRTWTAWYSEEVPASYGPWKLCGLPGMILQAKDKDNIFSFSFAGLIQRTAPIIYLSTNGCTTLQRNKFISHRNKLFCNKKYVEKPSYYIPQGTYDQLHIAEMWAGGPEPAAEEKLSVVSFDMVIPKKANAYQPLELK
jgi:GLPGLI family protein